jgi:hypothetical protein
MGVSSRESIGEAKVITLESDDVPVFFQLRERAVESTAELSAFEQNGKVSRS